MNRTTLEVPGWYIEFQAALLRQAPRPEEIDQVTAEGWINNQKSLKNNLAGCLIPPPVTAKLPRSNSLLEFVGIVLVPATTGKFIARDKFVINTKRNAPVKISCVNYNFKEYFLSGDGKTKDPMSEHALRYAKLCKESEDGTTIKELGGEAKAETTLSEMFSSMEKQGEGEDGALLNNGGANLFYIQDCSGVLRVVCVFWRDKDAGWRIRAFPVEDSGHWSVGDQVFSHNSVL